MTLWVPSSADYRWEVASFGTSRPAASFGTSVAVNTTANAYSSYVQLISGASVTEDVWAILINVNSVGISGVARDMIATVGVDPAGGTTYTDTINHLLVSCAAPYNIGSGGVWYCFPLAIAAGSSIGIKVSQNSTNGTAVRANCRLFGRPVHPESTRRGTFVETIGATTATSSGTSITSGTASKGTYTSLGATSKPTWWHQMGYGCNDLSMSAGVLHADLAADSAGARVLVKDFPVVTSAQEQVNNSPLTAGCVANVKGGTTLYARLQHSGTPDSALSLAAYCLGG